MARLNYIPPLSVTLLPEVSPDYAFGALSNLINLVDTFTVDTASKHSSTLLGLIRISQGTKVIL